MNVWKLTDWPDVLQMGMNSRGISQEGGRLSEKKGEISVSSVVE